MVNFKEKGVVIIDTTEYRFDENASILLRDGFNAYRPEPLALKLIDPIEGLPPMFIIPNCSDGTAFNNHLPQILAEIVTRWSGIPSGELARLIVAADAAEDRYGGSMHSKISQVVDLEGLHVPNRFIAFPPMPREIAPKGYPLTSESVIDQKGAANG